MNLSKYDIPNFNLKINVEPATSYLPSEIENVYRCDVLNMVIKRKWEMNTYSLSIQERRAWQRLKENDSILLYHQIKVAIKFSWIIPIMTTK